MLRFNCFIKLQSRSDAMFYNLVSEDQLWKQTMADSFSTRVSDPEGETPTVATLLMLSGLKMKHRQSTIRIRVTNTPSEPNWKIHICKSGQYSSNIDSHRPADDQVTLVGSISQTHPWIRQPASRVDTDVASLVWSHGVDHIEDHLKQRQAVNTGWRLALLRSNMFITEFSISSSRGSVFVVIQSGNWTISVYSESS